MKILLVFKVENLTKSVKFTIDNNVRRCGNKEKRV